MAYWDNNCGDDEYDYENPYEKISDQDDLKKDLDNFEKNDHDGQNEKKGNSGDEALCHKLENEKEEWRLLKKFHTYAEIHRLEMERRNLPEFLEKNKKRFVLTKNSSVLTAIIEGTIITGLVATLLLLWHQL